MTMKKRIEVEEADNGYTVKVYNHDEEDEDEKKDDFMYREPKVLVATNEEEVSGIFKKYLKGK